MSGGWSRDGHASRGHGHAGVAVARPEAPWQVRDDEVLASTELIMPTFLQRLAWRSEGRLRVRLSLGTVVFRVGVCIRRKDEVLDVEILGATIVPVIRWVGKFVRNSGRNVLHLVRESLKEL